MLIPLDEVLDRHDLRGRISGILHLGANVGEEAVAYQAAGISNVVWVEALPATVAELRRNVEHLGHRVIQAAVSDRAGDEVDFHVADNGQSSSLLEPKTHLVSSPNVHFNQVLTVTTTTVDQLAQEHDFSGLTMINADLQGAELLALSGAEQTLRQVSVLYLEVNTKELYKGCARLPELDRFLSDRGFKRVELRMAGRRAGWGDAIWLADPHLANEERNQSPWVRWKRTCSTFVQRVPPDPAD